MLQLMQNFFIFTDTKITALIKGYKKPHLGLIIA